MFLRRFLNQIHLLVWILIEEHLPIGIMAYLQYEIFDQI